MGLPDTKQALVWILAVAMLVSGILNFSSGANAPPAKQDVDLRTRALEFEEFSKGIYPNRRLQRENNIHSQAHTVYPPYALPMFALVFGNWSLPTASLIIRASSILALFAMMFLGWRCLREHGIAAAALGASIPWVFSGIESAVRVGQFSIICMGLLALQILFSERKMQVAAGICWAFAMIKPQIALPFALLFLPGHQWRALLVGFGFLAFLSGGALWWTGTDPWTYLRIGVLGQNLSFVDDSGISIGLFIKNLGIPPEASLAVALAVVLFLCVFFGTRLKHLKISPIALAAVASVVGHTVFYHRRYDNMMLLPLALILASLFFKGGYRLKEYLVYGAFFVSAFSTAKAVQSNAFLLTLAPVLALALVPFTVRGLRQQNPTAEKT